MPHRTLMWRVSFVKMMRRAGRSCRGKDARVLILTALEDMSSSCRSKMSEYAIIAFSLHCFLHISEKVVADCCVRRWGGVLLGRPLSVMCWGRWLV